MIFQKYDIDKDYQFLSLMTLSWQDEKAIRISNALLNRVNFLRVDSDIIAEKVSITAFDSTLIDLYIYKPKANPGNLPCMVYFHGGGFFLKGDALSPKILSDYVRKFNVIVVYVDYRLSIDYPYPTPLEDCYSGLKWSFENSDYIGIDNNKIFVTGFSAGGALAAGVSLLARDRKFNIIKAQILISPVTDHRQITASAIKFTDTPNWTSSSNKRMWELYLRELNEDVPYYASPIIAPDLKSLPPTYIEVSEFDPLHDEGVNFYSRIKEAGIYGELNDTKGTIHISSIALKSDKTQKNIDKIGIFIKKILNEAV